MPESDRPTSANPHHPKAQDSDDRAPQSDQIIDVRELVYRGGSDRDPRELVENPSVTPEMVEQAPEDLRDDLMPKQKSDSD